MKDNNQRGPILVFISQVLLLIGDAQGTPWALSSLRLCILILLTDDDTLMLLTNDDALAKDVSKESS